MKLYGTTTSPFVRRVAVVAAELGVTFERINTAGDDGQAVLREVSPIRKVPVAVVDARTIYDSRVINQYLITTRGWRELAPPRDPWEQENTINAIDAALDAAIQLFYLRRDGVAIDGTPYAERQLARIDAICFWLAERVDRERGLFTSSGGFGLAELALITTLDWMDFRKTYPTERAAGVLSVREQWRSRATLAATMPAA